MEQMNFVEAKLTNEKTEEIYHNSKKVADYLKEANDRIKHIKENEEQIQIYLTNINKYFHGKN